MPVTSNPTANRLSLLAKDAEQAAKYIDALTSLRSKGPDADPEGTIHAALMHAAIVVYARSFKKSERTNGEADKKVDLGQLQVAQDADLKALHTRIVDARDTMIAHSDWDKRRSTVVEKSPVEGSPSLSGLRATTMTQGWENIDERMFKKLVALVHEQAGNQAFDLERKMGE
jgi:hypothetical protein